MDTYIVQTAKTYAHEARTEELGLLRRLARIPAPSHKETRRAAFIRDWLLEAGARPEDVRIDDAGNVVFALSGADRGRASVYAAHMDVVAPDEDELPFHEDGERMYAPGVGDDTANLTGLLMAAKWIIDNKPQLKHDVLIVANSCEEGLGNLDGTRGLMRDLKEAGTEVISFTSFDLYLGQHITHAVGSHRWRVTCRTRGGHSWEDAGRPSAIEALCRVVCGLYAIPLPSGPKTTVNAGTIGGGTAVNAIASEARALLEYRSASQENLSYMREEFGRVLDEVRGDGVEVVAELIGERPASLADDPDGEEELVAEGDEAIRELAGVEPHEQDSSTDANIPLSLGIPAQTLGAVSGALLHTRDEWIDKSSLEPGLALILGTILGEAA